MLFVDLDDFKYVNDGFGHGAGDDVLTATADRLRETVGTAGLCARLGGDEFAVLLLRRRRRTSPRRWPGPSSTR